MTAGGWLCVIAIHTVAGPDYEVMKHVLYIVLKRFIQLVRSIT